MCQRPKTSISPTVLSGSWGTLLTTSRYTSARTPTRPESINGYEIALERCNCESANAIMIGDRIDNDIVPAKRKGMNTIWIKQGFGQYWNIRQEIEKPDFVVKI
ncbi:MAG: HAD hydrolase-like protein [Lachnospiraceae bacterium]|nr:HAD hydrolase-like protein [Lachnospiraceae bacterium]